MALANVLGRSACSILHQIAAEGISRQPKSSSRPFLSSWDVCSLTTFIQPLSSAAGIFIVAPLLTWSTSSHRPAPFDGTFVLFVASLLNFVLYVCSFSLNLNGSHREFSSRSSTESFTGCASHRCVPFIGEAISVSAGDMASLFQEANWSTTPLLGRSRRRALSDTLKMMERGEGSEENLSRHSKAT